MNLTRLLAFVLSAVVCSAAVRGLQQKLEVVDGEIEDLDARRALGMTSFDAILSKGKKGGGKYPASPAAAPVAGCTAAGGAGCGTPVADCTAGGGVGCGTPVAGTTTAGSAGKGSGKGSSGKGSSGKGSSGKESSGKGSSGKKGSDGKGYSSSGGKKGGKGYGKGSGGVNGTKPGTGTCGCPIDQVQLDFVMVPPNATVEVAPGVGLSQIGTVFVYNDALFDSNLTALPGTFIAGYCTRTQLTQNVDADNTLVGGGYCHFTMTVSDGAAAVTFNAAGEVFDVLGGTLALTGGTGALAGTYGEVEFMPVYESDDQIDYFTQAQLYVGSASLFVPLF